MIQLRLYNPKKGFREEEGVANLAALVAAGDEVVWAMVVAPSEGELDAVRDALGIHRILMEELAAEEDRPRLRYYNDVKSITFFAVQQAGDGTGDLSFAPLRIVLHANYLVTVTQEALPELDEAYSRWKSNTDVLEANSEAPLYTILDSVVDGFFPVMDEIADRVDEIEDAVVDGRDGGTRRLVFALKRSLVQMRRIAAAGRDTVNALIRHDDTTPDADAIYLRDVYDHLTRVTDAVDTYRDLLANVMDAYLSVTSNRLNVIMQTLTSWSIILGSWTLITGFYGMNTEGLPAAHRPFASQLVLGICLVVGAALFWVFRRKRWI